LADARLNRHNLVLLQTEQIRASKFGPAAGQTGAGLLESVAGFRRALRRRAVEAGGSGLSVSEIELFKTIAARPGLRVGEAAASLRLASNSVSTLIAQLERKGLVERRDHAGDGRGVVLYLTRTGEARRRRWRDRREELVGAALARLTGSERASLEQALPAFRSLVRLLEEQ
jgi:DNA-binding MarR family transcriptional regulator